MASWQSFQYVAALVGKNGVNLLIKIDALFEFVKIEPIYYVARNFVFIPC